MAALHQVHANNILDASLGTAAFIATVNPLRCRLMTANGTATAPGTELATSGGYTSGTGAPAVAFASTVSGSAASSSTVTVLNMPGATVPGVELWDSAPLRKWYGALVAPKTTNAGDTFSIVSGSLTAAVA